MRKTAMVLAWLAGLCILGIGIWLLVSQPSIEKDWLGVWVEEMEIGSPFDMSGAATITGIIALAIGGLTMIGALLIPTRFVVAGVMIVALDMLACLGVAMSPDPKWGVLVWAIPGLLMAFVGFLLGMELERVQEPEGVAELE